MENSLDYERFVKIYEEYQTLHSFEDKLNLWVKNDLLEFGYLIGDSKRKVTYDKHITGKPRKEIKRMYLDPTNDNEKRKLAEYAISLCEDEFISLQETYWQEISKSSAPKEYLFKSSNLIKNLIKNPQNFDSLKRFLRTCLTKGYENSVDGKEIQTIRIVDFGLDYLPIYVLDIKDLGDGIRNYLFGHEVAQYKGFLDEQQKRLDNGEDIRYPANTDTSKPVQTKEKKPYTQRAYALAYIYRQESGEYPKFIYEKKDCIALGKELGFSSRFYQTFSPMTNPNQRKYHIKAIKAAIELLGEYPLALQLAQKELSNSTR